MNMFTGEHTHTLDEKNRVSFPLRLRDCMLPDETLAGFYVTFGFEGSLLLYPKAEWDRVAQRVGELPSSQAEARKFQRLFLANAHFVTLDRQKRLLIPESHCRKAGIEKEVVFLGVGRHVEIWPRDRYERYAKSMQGEYEELAEKVFRDSPVEPGSGERARDDDRTA